MTTTALAHPLPKDSPGVNLMPPKVFYACLLLGGLIELIIPTDFPLLAEPLRLFLGCGLGAAGFVFMLAAHETFKRIGTNVPTNLPATTFVVRGAFRFSRNPMYVGGSAFFWGIAIIVDSLWMVAAYLPLGVYLSMYVIPREEAYMQRAYGDAYRQYRRNVRRWL